MLTLVAPEIQIKERQNWLNRFFTSTKIDSALVESPVGKKELDQAGFKGRIYRYNEHTSNTVSYTHLTLPTT